MNGEQRTHARKRKKTYNLEQRPKTDDTTQRTDRGLITSVAMRSKTDVSGMQRVHTQIKKRKEKQKQKQGSVMTHERRSLGLTCLSLARGSDVRPP